MNSEQEKQDAVNQLFDALLNVDLTFKCLNLTLGIEILKTHLPKDFENDNLENINQTLLKIVEGKITPIIAKKEFLQLRSDIETFPCDEKFKPDVITCVESILDFIKSNQ